MPILVAVSVWVLQKMSTVPMADQQQQSMNKMIIWMMPLLFAFFTLAFPSGLALFWVISNIIGIVMQYYITGWGSLFVKAPALCVGQSLDEHCQQTALCKVPQILCHEGPQALVSLEPACIQLLLLWARLEGPAQPHHTLNTRLKR